MSRLPSGIWVSKSRSKGRCYQRFEFVDPRTGRRCKRSDLAAAKAEHKKAWRLVLGRGVELVGRAAMEYADAVEAAREEPAASLADLVREAVIARRARRGKDGFAFSVAAVVKEFIAARKESGCGARHLDDLEQRLGAFSRGLPATMGELSPALVNDWLRGLGLGMRSRANYRGVLANFLGWSIKAKRLGRDFELDAIDIVKVRDGDIEVFTPDEFRWLLAGATDSVLPVLLFGGFAGLRTSEIMKLQWNHVSFAKQGHIRVAIGKTGRRIVPLVPNLRAWLEPLRDEGPIVRITDNGISKAYVRAAAAANKLLAQEHEGWRVKWKHNALRHSFASYRFAALGDAARVAAECGHTVRTMTKCYKEAVSEEEAKAWFAIMPATRQAVTQLSLFSEKPRTSGIELKTCNTRGR